jgi:hypothetical protein
MEELYTRDSDHDPVLSDKKTGAVCDLLRFSQEDNLMGIQTRPSDSALGLAHGQLSAAALQLLTPLDQFRSQQIQRPDAQTGDSRLTILRYGIEVAILLGLGDLVLPSGSFVIVGTPGKHDNSPYLS